MESDKEDNDILFSLMADAATAAANVTAMIEEEETMMEEEYE